MSKVILAMDEPNACIDCPCHFADDKMIWCGKKKKEILANNIEVFKLDWCPLKEVPKKIEKATGDMDYYKAVGFNACIDEILKD